ncbi:hypothetical protein CBOM_07516 [Ceraceosorus bombacis]|uniref:Uncharacterized protein n=1 Tax=Ceraceosorus bombacis TaxID=401625 RepID=A0A0P1BDQ8_9BASI|nr:hypothetical protein CBOM_07516 [Ceraceosorus bombacis]
MLHVAPSTEDSLVSSYTALHLRPASLRFRRHHVSHMPCFVRRRRIAYILRSGRQALIRVSST